MANYLDKAGATYLVGKVKAELNKKVDKVDGKGLSTHDFTTAEKTKLAGIAEGANKYELPVASDSVLGGIKSGGDITIDAQGNVTVNDKSHNHAIEDVEGLQNALDNKVEVESGKGLSTNDYTTTEKTKLANIAEGANKTIVDESLSNTSTNPVQNKAVNTALENKVDKVTGKGLSEEDYTSTEKTKLAGIEEGANKTVVDAALSGTSENPVQNKAVNTALGNKVDKVSGKGLSTNDFTNAEKEKLAGIAAGANAYTLPVAGADLGGVKSGGDITIDAQGVMTVNDDSHNHTIGNVDGLQDALDAKAPLVSPALTGTPTAPTPAKGTNSTQVATTAFVATAVADAVGGVAQFKMEPVESLPSSGASDTIYLLPNAGTGNNSYDEYLWVNNKFEKIGTTDIDLTKYWSKTELVALTNEEIDAMFA